MRNACAARTKPPTSTRPSLRTRPGAMPACADHVPPAAPPAGVLGLLGDENLHRGIQIREKPGSQGAASSVDTPWHVACSLSSREVTMNPIPPGVAPPASVALNGYLEALLLITVASLFALFAMALLEMRRTYRRRE